MVIKLNGHPYNCPSCYEELTTATYQRIIAEWDHDKPLAERDYFKLFSILTGSDFKSFANTSENEVTIWDAIKWFVEQPFNPPTEIPKALKIGEKIIDVPQDMGKLSIGQNIVLRQILEKKKFLEESISLAAAIYLQPAYSDDKFDYSKVKRIDELIANLPIYLTYPIGFFLLTSAAGYGKPTTNRWRRILRSLALRIATAWPSSRRYPGYRLSAALIPLTSMLSGFLATLTTSLRTPPSIL